MSNFKVIHGLTLNCKKEVKSTQKQLSCEKVVWLLKSLGEKKWEIKGGSQEWLQAVMLMLINFNNDCGNIVKIY